MPYHGNFALRAALALLVGLSLIAPASAQEPERKEGDLLVIGRLKNLRYDLIYDPDDILGHGRITARLRVTQVVWGKMKRRTLRVHYVAHSYLRSDRDFCLHLRKSRDADFAVIRSTPIDNGTPCS